MRDIVAVSCDHVGGKVDAAIAQIRILIAEESASLLQSVSIANAYSARHVGDGKTLDCKAPVNSLTSNEYPAICVEPFDLRGPATSGVDLKNACQANGARKRRSASRRDCGGVSASSGSTANS